MKGEGVGVMTKTDVGSVWLVHLCPFHMRAFRNDPFCHIEFVCFEIHAF